MATHRCKKCGYTGDRLIFTFTDRSYCTASNDDYPEYMGSAPEWVTAGGAEIGEPVGCPECRNWGVSEFELTEEGHAKICKKIIEGETMKKIRRNGKVFYTNNLKLRQDKVRKLWQVITPDKRILEEFRFEKDAILFAQDTKDFLTEKGRKRKYGK